MLYNEMEKLQILVVKRFNNKHVDEFDGQRLGLENTTLCNDWVTKGSNNYDTNITPKSRTRNGKI